MKKSIWIILLTVLAFCAAGFLYTFLEPRYTATVVRVGRARTVTSSSRHRRRRRTVIPLTVKGRPIVSDLLRIIYSVVFR